MIQLVSRILTFSLLTFLSKSMDFGCLSVVRRTKLAHSFVLLPDLSYKVRVATSAKRKHGLPRFLQHHVCKMYRRNT
jgi:hypothetical protein